MFFKKESLKCLICKEHLNCTLYIYIVKLIPCYSLHLFKIHISETLPFFLSISSLVHFYIFFCLLRIILPSNSFLFIPCSTGSNQFPRTKKDPFIYRSLMSSPPESSYKVASTQLIIAGVSGSTFLSSKLCVAFRINWSCGKTTQESMDVFHAAL